MFAPKNRTRRTRVAMCALVIGLGLAASACRGSDGGASGSESDTYKVGVLLGLTGNYAALGVPERNSIERFFKQANEDGGINGRKVELVVVDTGSDESQAVNQLRELATQEQVHAVIGPSSSGSSIALKPISKSLEVPVISLASSKQIVTPIDEAEYMFKQFPSTAVSLQAQLSYAEEQGLKRVAILGVNTGYGQEPVEQLPKAIEEFDLDLVSSETFPPGATNVTAQLTRIARSKPDVLLVWAVNPASAVVSRSARTVGFDAVLFHSPGAGSPGYIKTAGKAAEGTLVQGSKILVVDSIAEDDPQHDVVTQFVGVYRDAYGDVPGQFAGNGWDGSLILQAALEGIDPELSSTQEVRDAIRDSLEQNVKDLAGVNAIYTYSPENHGPQGIEGLAVLGVTDGAFTLEQAY